MIRVLTWRVEHTLLIRREVSWVKNKVIKRWLNAAPNILPNVSRWTESLGKQRTLRKETDYHSYYECVLGNTCWLLAFLWILMMKVEAAWWELGTEFLFRLASTSPWLWVSHFPSGFQLIPCKWRVWTLTPHIDHNYIFCLGRVSKIFPQNFSSCNLLSSLS